jgi:SRSO17 transposase
LKALQSPERRTNAHHCEQGLLSDLYGKDAESIAYLHGQDRQVMQKFLGQADSDHRPLVATLARKISNELGEDDEVLVFDLSAFAKKGTESVSVQR